LLQRVWLSWGVMTVIAAMLLASPASARRRKKKAAKPPAVLDIAVVPFGVLRGADSKAASDALELELELVDRVRVQDAGAVSADLSAASDPFSPAVIKKAMARRSLEVLVTAPAGFARPFIVVYASDGKPRVLKELPRGAGPDEMAATALAVIKPALPKWSSLKPLPLPARAGRGVDVDVLGDDDDDDDDVADNGRGGGSTDRRAPADPDDDADAGGSGTNDRRRTAGLDDDDDGSDLGKKRGALDAGDGDSLDQRRRRSLADVEDGASGSAAGPTKLSHILALSGTFDGAGWYYAFEGNDNVQPVPVGAGFHPGGSVRADLWLQDFVGVDVSAALSTVQFQINSNPNLEVAPNRFLSVHANAGVSGRGRLLLHLSDDGPLRTIGLGARLGYRFWQGSVETQRILANNRILTVVPGFSMHALTVGPELYVPIFALDRRFEIELKIDTMPLTRYAETPDNPGKNSLAFGYHAELLARFDLYGGFFVELAGKSTGATVNFEGEGDRVTVGGNETDLVTLKGGRSVNVAGGFSVGVGFMY
jgi:hypothetical protein